MSHKNVLKMQRTSWALFLKFKCNLISSKRHKKADCPEIDGYAFQAKFSLCSFVEYDLLYHINDGY